jgi:hypothetical protein
MYLQDFVLISSTTSKKMFPLRHVALEVVSFACRSDAFEASYLAIKEFPQWLKPSGLPRTAVRDEAPTPDAKHFGGKRLNAVPPRANA